MRAPILDEVDGIKIAIFAYAVKETNIKNYNKFPGWVNTWNETEILEWVNLCKKKKNHYFQYSLGDRLCILS